MNEIILFFLFPLNLILPQIESDKLNGTYYSVNNGFERWSIMHLTADNKFIYSYGGGGCQAKVSGTYKVLNGKIKFRNDKKFTKEYLETLETEFVLNDTTIINFDTPMYPDLSLIEWEISKKSIKPLAQVDSGCLKEAGKHKKRK